jgi:hypothetical protein
VRKYYIAVLLVLALLGFSINSYGGGGYSGEYLIQNTASGLSLVPNPETVNRNFGKLCLHSVKNNHSAADQRWHIVDTGNGFLIKSVKSGLSLVPYRETVYKNFGRLCLYDVIGTGVNDQRWHFVKTGNGVLIQNRESGLFLVPDPKTVDKNFGKLYLYQTDPARADRDQKWHLVKVK